MPVKLKKCFWYVLAFWLQERCHRFSLFFLLVFCCDWLSDEASHAPAFSKEGLEVVGLKENLFAK